ncbi:AraC family transcriptional regulator [Oceanospirillum beijerinckii]|uniref:AraC family transcriptional regulator n=1 Tax=Oceanospirillum beijerinckii TaxID=64976 RepID=UPI0003F8E3D7|nr:AraC family transcriptional regulator [Oceanospirillum beijerinckii]
MPIATASSKLLEPILQLASHYDSGADDDSDSLRHQILSAASLSDTDFTRPDARFPADHFSSVLSCLAEASGNPHITLRLAEATQPRMLGSIGFLISTSETLGQALHILEDYLPILFQGAQLELHQHGQDMQLQLLFEAENVEQNVVEYFLACLLNWPRWLTGRQIPVSAVEMTFPQPENLTTYRQFFAAEVSFQAERHCIHLPASYLTLPCVDANREMHQLHKEFADSLLSKTGEKKALTAQIRSLIRQQLLTQGEAIRREQIAQQLGLSLRTLQRKLGELETNFQTLYDQTRQELCLQLIQRGQLSFGEIAFQLGFSNQSAFQKAFKRWMGMAPSQYRQQLAPLEVSSAPLAGRDNTSEISRESKAGGTVEALIPSASTMDSLIQQLPTKLEKLNPFGLKTLYRAAVYGKSFNLKHLAEITADPLARLMIHLWPAEQEGLIKAVPNQLEPVEFCFTCAEIQDYLYQQLGVEQRQKYHAQLGQVLFDHLPEEPILQSLSIALHHLNQSSISQPSIGQPHSVTERLKTALSPQQLYRLNRQAAQQAQQQGQFALALDYLQQAQTVFSHCSNPVECNQPSLDHEEGHTLWLQQGQLHLKLSQFVEAEACVQALEKEPLKPLQLVQLSLLKARIHQYRNQQSDALAVLLQQQIDLPREDKDQLLFLLYTLEQIQALRQQVTYSESMKTDDTNTDTNIGSDKAENDKIDINEDAEIRGADSLELRVLQQAQLELISLLAQQQAQPLLSACAISQMTLDSLQLPANDFTCFAFIGYAWVASWFCGDYELAQHFLQQGLQQAHQQRTAESTERGLANTEDVFANQELIDKRALSSISAELCYSSQIQHWFEPLPKVLKQLKQIANSSNKAGDELLQSELRLLMHQVALVSSDQSLSKALQRCDKHYQQMLPQQHFQAARLKESTVQLIHYLQGKALLPAEARYDNAWQASALIQGALLLDQQSLWPQMYQWQARLENELPGYFIISEALFCTAMMRLIQSQQEQQLSRRRQRIIEQIESRFELWAQHCPENFSVQLILLRAEKASLQQQLNSVGGGYEACVFDKSGEKISSVQPSDAAALYEQALAELEQQARPYHKALAYERYGHYLHVTQQPRLAQFCRDEAKRLYQAWGASAKVKQLH